MSENTCNAPQSSHEWEMTTTTTPNQISLRDTIAIHAMSGIISKGVYSNCRQVVSEAYRFADEMIKFRDTPLPVKPF